MVPLYFTNLGLPSVERSERSLFCAGSESEPSTKRSTSGNPQIYFSRNCLSLFEILNNNKIQINKIENLNLFNNSYFEFWNFCLEFRISDFLFLSLPPSTFHFSLFIFHFSLFTFHFFLPPSPIF